MFSLSSIILAFFAGILGTLIGGTQTFICTGFVGLLIFLLEHVGVNTTFLNEALSNNLFLPCIIFNAAGLATAYAGTKHEIRGVETSRSLAFTNDPKVLLVGAIGDATVWRLCLWPTSWTAWFWCPTAIRSFPAWSWPRSESVV